MLPAKGAGVAHRVSGADARRNDQLGGKVGLLATAKTKPPQVTRTELIGSDNSKAGSHSDAAAKDSAVVCSLALQHGVPVETIRRALLRDARGVASSPLGDALDLLAEDGDA